MRWLKKQKTTKPAGKPIRVSDILSEKNIAFFPAGPSKRQVFGNLIGSLDLPDPNAALKAILAREEAGSTVIAPGVAIPHARFSGIKHVVAALGICPSGVVDPRAKGGPLHLFVLFLGPVDNMREHLAFLASVSALLQMKNLKEGLLALTTPQAVLEVIRQAEKSL
jgi:mannitol/fructose-specific phosphotransferase system IIA component (Ntr-type)